MTVMNDGAVQVETAPRAVAERVLIVEDDAAARVGLEQLVKSWGFLAQSAVDGEDALEKVTSFRPAIVISDLVMPRLDGLGLLRALQTQGADVTTLLLTAQGTVETAVEAMKEGAYDYLTKPVDIQRLKILLDQIVARLETLREVKSLRRQLRESGTFGSMIGNSPEMRKIYQVIEQAAPTGASVLITGESGTGKELVAQTIHQLSPRATFPFVAINCAAIPETLLESEIFGHEKGAFTGAADRRQGCFELADRGTLFLDEIGNLPLHQQSKLLRVLQSGEVERVGDSRPRQVNVRVLAATNVDLHAEVEAGRFREDLLFRLNTIEIQLPPLRERRDDVAPLANFFLRKHATRYGKPLASFDNAAVQALLEHPWPGNIRELDHVVERAVLLAQGEQVRALDLALRAGAAPSARGEEVTLEEAERVLIQKALSRYDGNVSHAAKALGISRSALYRRLAAHGL
jgi:DNA-binding NtrC family response regulator